MGGDSVSGHEKMPQTFSISAALARKQKWTVSCRHRPFSVLLFPCLRPHAGGDPYRPPGSTHPSYFDPRPPVRGGDLVEAGLLYPSFDFNPRPPCGGRLPRPRAGSLWTNFNPRPPCGGRLPLLWRSMAKPYFNPRPPCGGRHSRPSTFHVIELFQSTPPVRGATLVGDIRVVDVVISIHAPRAGGDAGSFGRRSRHADFNPRPPCGGRRGYI